MTILSTGGRTGPRDHNPMSTQHQQKCYEVVVYVPRKGIAELQMWATDTSNVLVRVLSQFDSGSQILKCTLVPITKGTSEKRVSVYG